MYNKALLYQCFSWPWRRVPWHCTATLKVMMAYGFCLQRQQYRLTSAPCPLVWSPSVYQVFLWYLFAGSHENVNQVFANNNSVVSASSFFYKLVSPIFATLVTLSSPRVTTTRRNFVATLRQALFCDIAKDCIHQIVLIDQAT